MPKLIQWDNAEALKFLVAWVHLLSEDRYDEAVDMLRVRPRPVRGSEFAPSLKLLGL